MMCAAILAVVTPATSTAAGIAGVSPYSYNAALYRYWAVDVNKEQDVLRVLWGHRGHVYISDQTAIATGGWIGGVHYVTPDGVFAIYAKGGPNTRVHCRCAWNGAPMPWATYFYRGDAIHQDGLFPSHGCVHVPSWYLAERIHNLPYGTTVVVH
jgi:hypothetical protein